MFVDQSFEVPLKLACYIPVLDEKSKLHVLRHGRSRQIRARHENGVSIREDKSGAVPLVCHYASGPVRLQQVYLLEDYTAELAACHGIHSYGGVNLTLKDLLCRSAEILGDHVLTRERVLEQDIIPDQEIISDQDIIPEQDIISDPILSQLHSGSR